MIEAAAAETVYKWKINEARRIQVRPIQAPSLGNIL